MPMPSGKHELMPIAQIELDLSNPRIAKFLEMYEKPTAEQVYLALGAGDGDVDSQGGSTFNRLKQSILTNGGIIQPIIVNRVGKKLICIEGNTRVALYRQFADDKITGSWKSIPAVIYDNLDEEQIDAIRLQAHLVGPRQWDPYSKAKYLSYLRNKEHFPFSKLVDYCGGSQKTVQESIDAYHDMEHYYRPILESDADFDPRRFSGFVELQRPNVKQAILNAKCDFADFAKWIHERRIDALAEVRYLPKILSTPKAKEVFFKANAFEAIKMLDRPDLNKALKDATLEQLARALAEQIRIISWKHVQDLKNNPDSDAVRELLGAFDALDGLVKDIKAS
jgi:hypothetical protein